jgi:pimeloyl-ACP methyl ester carboxylesterase
VVAPDLRGAWTDAPADGYTVDQALADVLALLDALGLRRVGLVAHDFSAFVGFRLCFDHPERVAAFLCLGPHPYLRFKPQMLAGIPQLCGSSRLSPRRGWHQAAPGADFLRNPARSNLPEKRETPDPRVNPGVSANDEDQTS